MMYRSLAPLFASCAALALPAALPATMVQPAVPHAAASAQVPRYTFTDLGVLSPGLDSQARALSDRGQVAGLADTCPGCGPFGYQAFLWTPTRSGGTAGSLIGLGTLPGTARSAATGVNDSGVVVGESFYPALGRAFIYNGTLDELGSLHPGSPSGAAGINAAGAVVGYSAMANGLDHAFLWVPDKREGSRGKMYDLGTPPGQASSSATAINDQGVIVGSSLNADFLGGRAFIWRPSRPHATTGTMTKLPQPRGVTGSAATAINDHGLIVGTLITAGGQAHAFLFTTAMHDLGTLPGGADSIAYGINSHGPAVGYSDIASGSFHAVIWSDGRITDLNRLLPRTVKAAGVVLGKAYGINNKGQIAGIADVRGHAHGFLLTPTG